MKKLLNPITKVTGAVTSSITYNTMTSYTYIGKKKVCNTANNVKNKTTKTIDNVKTKLTKKDK
jgi:hypothetical protein